MKQFYSIPSRALRALAPFAARKDIRGYLCGVHLDVDAIGNGRAAATNGHILGVMQFSCDAEDTREPLSITIPLEALKSINARSSMFVSLERFDDLRWILNGQLFTPIEGRFPDYVRAIPDKVTGLASQADPVYLALFGESSKILTGKTFNVRIGWNREPVNPDWPTTHDPADSGALVEISGEPNFIGVLMPVRYSTADVPRTAPDWSKVRIDTVAQLAQVA